MSGILMKSASTVCDPVFTLRFLCATNVPLISTANKLGTECPNRLYVFERIPGYKFEGITDKEVIAANRTECGDQCLSQTEFPCRSATFDKTSNKCWLSRETRYMNPRGFKTDPNADYLENMCLKRMFKPSLKLFLTKTLSLLMMGRISNVHIDGIHTRNE